MDWWILELIFVAVMIAVVGVLGPLIKRFGKAYAADVFQANPRTGKSYLVLMDFAYYMIFGAYILFVIKWEPDTGWDEHGQRRPGPGVGRPTRRHGAAHGPPPRSQRAQPADHRPGVHAQQTSRRRGRRPPRRLTATQLESVASLATAPVRHRERPSGHPHERSRP